MLRGYDKGPEFGVPLAKGQSPPVEDSPSFWHPQRFGVKYASDTFRKRLQLIHPDLDATWHPLRERWLVWYRRPRISHHVSPGWLLLFIAETSTHEYVPLDERVLAAVYEQSGFKWGSGKKYWARVEEESRREKELADISRNQYVHDVGGDYYDHTKIQVSMCGHSSGSKFVEHHAGD
jgi:hypothetical protein